MIFCKPKLVKFKTGGFGVRRFTLTGYEYLSQMGNWRSHLADVDTFCRQKTIEDAKSILDRFTVDSTPVKCD